MADTETDAAYILEQHLNSINSEEEFETLKQTALSEMHSNFDDLGAQIIDPDRFAEELFGEFETYFFSNLRETLAKTYQDFMTDEEIAALADFYRSDKGQELLRQGLSEDTLADNIAFIKGGAGAPLLRILFNSSARMDDFHDEITARLGEVFSLDRIADLMEMETIVVFESDEHRQYVVDGLRQAHKKSR